MFVRFVEELGQFDFFDVYVKICLLLNWLELLTFVIKLAMKVHQSWTQFIEFYHVCWLHEDVKDLSI
jgi:hypothetical protein